MKRIFLRRVPVLALIAALALAAAGPAAAQERDTVAGDRGAAMAVDLLLVRPLSLAATVIGTAGFIVSLPFTVPSDSVDETAHEWVAAPFEYTFNRPLGDFDSCGADRRPCGQ